MISSKQKFSLIYFMSKCFFLSSGYTIIFKTSFKDSWLSMIIGIIIGTLFIYIFNKCCFNEKKKYVLNQKHNLFQKCIFLLYFTFLMYINVLAVRVFATSFFLTRTPGLFITIPFIYLCYLNSKKGLNTISKVSEILMPISLFIIIFTILAVIKDGSIASFLPALTTKKSNIIKSSLYFSIFTTIPHLSLFDTKIELKKHIKYYIISTLVISSIGITIIYVLGPTLIQIFRFPEYMTLKQLKIFNFIEKMENIIGLNWFFDLLISSSLCLYNIGKITKENNIIIITIISVVLLGVEYLSNHYEYASLIYKYLPILMLIVGSIFFLLIFSVKRKIKKAADAT